MGGLHSEFPKAVGVGRKQISEHLGGSTGGGAKIRRIRRAARHREYAGYLRIDGSRALASVAFLVRGGAYYGIVHGGVNESEISRGERHGNEVCKHLLHRDFIPAVSRPA